jgi:hypothetical protein
MAYLSDADALRRALILAKRHRCAGLKRILRGSRLWRQFTSTGRPR